MKIILIIFLAFRINNNNNYECLNVNLYVKYFVNLLYEKVCKNVLFFNTTKDGHSLVTENI